MTLLKKTKVIMELSSINNMEYFGDFGTPEPANLSANDLFEGLNWNMDTVPEGSSVEEWMKPFGEFDEIQEVEGVDTSCLGIETEFDTSKTQNLIDEVEEFLDKHEKSLTGKSSTKSEDLPMNSSYFDDSGIDEDTDMKNAESLLDALITGNVINTASSSSSNNSNIQEDDVLSLVESVSSLPPSFIPPQKQEFPKTINLNDIMASGAANIVDCSKLTNVSEFVLEDGRNVIIMIAAPSTGDSIEKKESGSMGSNPISPPSYDLSDTSDDTEWLPQQKVKSDKKRGSPRTAVPPPTAFVKKGNGINKKVKSTILDKKERKKWQNVEAARRYRDKKKLEQSQSETEVKMLEDKNASLKEKIGQMTNELSTLKKLMLELGLIKTSDF